MIMISPLPWIHPVDLGKHPLPPPLIDLVIRKEYFTV